MSKNKEETMFRMVSLYSNCDFVYMKMKETTCIYTRNKVKKISKSSQ